MKSSGCGWNKLLMNFTSISRQNRCTLFLTYSILYLHRTCAQGSVENSNLFYLNYWGIALLNTSCKIFTQILNARLQCYSEENEILRENQTGFRISRGTTGNIFIITAKAYLQLRLSKRTAYAIFVDFRRAFDTLKHDILWQKLYDAGVSSKLIRIIQNICKKAVLQIKLNDKLWNPITIMQGELQGVILGPIIFALFINDLWILTVSTTCCYSHMSTILFQCAIFQLIYGKYSYSKYGKDKNTEVF